jgi:hypothetical protein
MKDAQARKALTDFFTHVTLLPLTGFDIRSALAESNGQGQPMRAKVPVLCDEKQYFRVFMHRSSPNKIIHTF